MVNVKLTAAWQLTRSDERVDVYETRYRPRKPMELPLSEDDWKKVKRKLHERLRKHQTKFAYVRLQLLIEEGLYAVTFDIDPKSGLVIEWMNTPTVPRNRDGVFTEDELFKVTRRLIADIEEKVTGDEPRGCFIRSFDIVAHNGFWEKIKRGDSSNKKTKKPFRGFRRTGLSKKS